MESVPLQNDQRVILSRNERWLCALLALCVLNFFCQYGIRMPMMVYYFAMGSLNVLIFVFGARRGFSLKPAMWLFWGLMWISVLVNAPEIPPQFRAVERTISFALVLIGIGPFFLGEHFFVMRREILSYLNLGILFITLLSFAGYIFGFGSRSHQGFYQGATHHSMILGAFAGISMLNCLYEAMISSQKRYQFFCLICSVTSLVTGILASSRISLASCICGVISMLALNYRGRYGKTIPKIIVFLFIGLVFLHFSGDVGFGLRQKHHGQELSLETLSSTRKGLWNDRLSEIKHEPLFGVGAHTIRAEYCLSEHSQITTAGGTIEPGSAWLYIFSSMGVFAFLCFCVIILEPLYRIWKQGKTNSLGVILFSQLVFFSVYMCAEAHITASGDFTFIYCWLLIALVDSHNRNEYNLPYPHIAWIRRFAHE
jgi:O-antigen ligase